MFKKFFLIIIFFSLAINSLKADEKVFYIDVDYLMTNTLAGKELSNILKKEEELKLNKFRSNDDNFKIEEKKILAKKNLISKEELTNEMKSLQVKFQKYRTEKIKEIEIHKSFANDLHISPFCLQRMHISPIKWSALLCFNIGWQHISARNGHSLI